MRAEAAGSVCCCLDSVAESESVCSCLDSVAEGVSLIKRVNTSGGLSLSIIPRFIGISVRVNVTHLKESRTGSQKLTIAMKGSHDME